METEMLIELVESALCELAHNVCPFCDRDIGMSDYLNEDTIEEWLKKWLKKERERQIVIKIGVWK